MEPLVIGSLWGKSLGQQRGDAGLNWHTVRLEDDLDDVWGEVSAGVNFFNPSDSTSVFAKFDVIVRDDIDSVGKASVRVSW